MKSLLTNHHLQGYRLLHHILQTYHPLYNKDASNHIIECPHQQFYDNFARHIVKFPMQEYYDAYACYLMMEVYINNSSKTLVDPTELCVFVHRCIRDKDLYQATRFDQENDECKFKFLPHNLVQTLLLEFSRLPSDRRPLERYSNHSSDRRFAGSSRSPRQSYTSRRTSGSSLTTAGFLPEHQNDFLKNIINVVKIYPHRAFTPDCIYC